MKKIKRFIRQFDDSIPDTCCLGLVILCLLILLAMTLFAWQLIVGSVILAIVAYGIGRLAKLLK